MVEGAVAAVVEVVVNKRRKKFKSRKVRRARIRSFSSGWLVNGLGLHGLGLLGCVANLCFTVPVLYFIFIFMYDDMAHLRGVVPLVAAACVSGGLLYFGWVIPGGGGGGSCSGCSDGGGGGGGDGRRRDLARRLAAERRERDRDGPADSEATEDGQDTHRRPKSRPRKELPLFPPSRERVGAHAGWSLPSIAATEKWSVSRSTPAPRRASRLI